ncbi:MAG: magnesium protoporphyrin IX methyltransferase [Pseudomonadota bacterium]
MSDPTANSSYSATRARLEDYFDGTAAETWARLTSDAPVSRIRRTVRAGRDRMRDALLSRLPTDLRGRRVLDAGCGAGQAAAILAARGAEVVAADISPSLLQVAIERTPASLRGRITFLTADMTDPGLGRFDHVLAMDSLIHYRAGDIAATLDRLAASTSGRIVFTVAPRNPLLSTMHAVGKLFPRSNRSPAIVPVSDQRLAREISALPVAGARHLRRIERVSSGFYISQAMELSP